MRSPSIWGRDFPMWLLWGSLMLLLVTHHCCYVSNPNKLMGPQDKLRQNVLWFVIGIFRENGCCSHLPQGGKNPCDKLTSRKDFVGCYVLRCVDFYNSSKFLQRSPFLFPLKKQEYLAVSLPFPLPGILSWNCKINLFSLPNLLSLLNRCQNQKRT